MSSYIEYVQDSSQVTGGCICENCGVWVPFGQFHACNNVPYNNFTHTTCNDCALLSQLSTLIERIDALLAKLEAKA